MKARSRARRRWLVLLWLGLVASAGCASAPPTLSPPAVTAFHHHRIQQALDLIRDTAQDAHATVPPTLSTATTRTVTVWHQSAITILHASGSGWQAAVRTSLDELLKDVPEPERALLTPYVALAKTVLAEVTR